jgi:surfeit locus 1 family protein
VDEAAQRAERDGGSTARAWRRAVPTLAAVVAIVVFVTAGNWQRGRMNEKEALAAQVAAAEAAPPLPMSRVDRDAAGLRFRALEATGRFDPTRQVLLDNRVHRGRFGYHVVTPLLLADGRAVLVNRGFAPGGATRSDLPEAPPPSGEVTIRGRLNQPPPRYLELGEARRPGRVWQNLDPAGFEAATGLAVLPFVIEMTDGPPDGLVREWQRPDFSGDRHRVYMLQWYAFAALAGGLWLWFTLRRRR